MLIKCRVLLLDAVKGVEIAFLYCVFEPVLMAILGGTGYFLGPFVGSAVFVLLETWITSFTESWMLVLGIILAMMVIFFRKGLLGTALDWWMEVKK